jgi:hypothetical protein
MGTINASDVQLRAIETLKDVLADSTSRNAFASAQGTEEKEAVFNSKRDQLGRPDVDYRDHIPDGPRRLIESLSEEQLEFLADVDATFVKAGLSVSSNPSASMIY